MKLSSLSNTPPCPGIMLPLSFTPKVLFSWLSTKSPIGAATETSRPTKIQLPLISGIYFSIKNPKTKVQITPPAKPSQVFFGLIFGAILCFPNILPAKYAKPSLLQIKTKSMKISQPKGCSLE